MKTGPRVVLFGILGRTPCAGVAWQALHYLEGFRRIGCEVYYVEDTGDWPYDADRFTISDDCTFTLRYLARHMAMVGMSDRWAYRSGVDQRVYGMSATQLSDLLASADVLVNLTGSTLLREAHMRVPKRIYLETDPVRPQVEIAQGNRVTWGMLAGHTHHFSYGENFGAPDCGVPMGEFTYLPTRQPVVLDWWAGESAAPPVSSPGRYTTVGSWKQSSKDFEWNGESYTWSKHVEFLKFVDLPRLAGASFELALAGVDPASEALLNGHGWRVADGYALSRDIEPYRDFIRDSRGEFTVAKDQNVRLRSGWFSDRSACYLAAGLPVITQDTAFGSVVPTGRGLYAFRTMEDILAALDAIEADYEANRAAARDIADAYFDACGVVERMLRQAGL